MSEFIDFHKEHIDSFGLWTEEYNSTIIHTIENRYKTEHIREWYISEFTIKGDKTLIKWRKRIYALTDEELKVKYGRDVE